MQFEILKIPGIDFYSGFKKNARGGGVQFVILKKIQVYTCIVASGKPLNGERWERDKGEERERGSEGEEIIWLPKFMII